MSLYLDFKEFVAKTLRKIVIRFDKYYYAKKEFKDCFGRELDFKHPRNLVEKFYWLERYSDISLMSKCTDKYSVRDFIKERGCEDILNELYCQWSSPNEIALNSIPSNSFIMKMNNGSGDVIIVKDKSFASERDIKHHFKKLFKVKYGEDNAQNHYVGIKPCIVVEKLLSSSLTPWSSSLVDYKIWCFDGEPYCIWVAYNRTNHSLCMDLFDIHWNNMPQYLNPDNHYQYHPENKIPKPASLDRMLEYASALSKGFPEVRVDLYDVDGKVVFGELTFTSGYGYFTNDFYDILGDKTQLPKGSELK